VARRQGDLAPWTSRLTRYLDFTLQGSGADGNGVSSSKLDITHTFWGLCPRLLTKLAAHTLCIYLNRLLDKADFLPIKALAFPI
jgi:hypothetical protein